jgi:soluble lytic murein transglycosylase-like protein
MSTGSIGTRVAEIDQMLAAVGGRQVAASTASTTSFAQALTSAQGTISTTAAGASAPAGGIPFAAEIDAAAARYGVDPALLKGLIRQESGFDPSARSSAGATGLTQLMPGTAASLGVDPTDPAQAIDGGARYLKAQLDRFGGDAAQALAAYNAGPGAVAKYGGIPPYAETQSYVQKVLGYAAEYRGAVAPAAAGFPPMTTPVPAAATPAGLGYSTI